MPNQDIENNVSKQPFPQDQVVKRNDPRASGALFLLTDGSYFPTTGQFGATVLLRQTDTGATGRYSIHWHADAFESSSWEELKVFENTLQELRQSNR